MSFVSDTDFRVRADYSYAAHNSLASAVSTDDFLDLVDKLQTQADVIAQLRGENRLMRFLEYGQRSGDVPTSPEEYVAQRSAELERQLGQANALADQQAGQARQLRVELMEAREDIQRLRDELVTSRQNLVDMTAERDALELRSRQEMGGPGLGGGEGESQSTQGQPESSSTELGESLQLESEMF